MIQVYRPGGEQSRLAANYDDDEDSDEKVDEVQSVTESYQKYKREYVKHLSFKHEEENLGGYFFIP